MGLWDAPRPGRNRTWKEEDWQVIEDLVKVIKVLEGFGFSIV
jgi:hypothetical protein